MAIWIIVAGGFGFVVFLIILLLLRHHKEQSAPEPQGMPQGLPDLATWAQRPGTCRQCNQQADGSSYEFHYGKFMRTIFGLALNKHLYNVMGKISAFICDTCVKKQVSRNSLAYALLILPISIPLLAIIVYRAFFLPSTVAHNPITSSEFFGIAFSALVTLFGFVSLYRVFRPSVNRTTGEQIAIKVLHYPIKRRTGATHFWDNRKFAQLKPYV